ncbi:unnamed protein product [Pieris macdunnoughi]|uniref:NADP-dependent oxidoreductase domain-containing protein n=1 Tax=Pieris macdunnoughi TaxID=345717 RepID=A0A821YEL1_9NEOP|nr:unnamed protein product [Pieris macdunnoughi]
MSPLMVWGAQGEAELGRILKKRNVNRSSIIITTKIYWSTKCEERGQSRKHIIESVNESLGRLQLEYIDLVLVHKVDPVCPMEELVRTMDYLINQGYAMYWGTARWTPTEHIVALSMDCTPEMRRGDHVTSTVTASEVALNLLCRALLSMVDALSFDRPRNSFDRETQR